jgi:hypothetical protein
VARHLAAEARTLCLAARLLEPSNQKVAEAEKGLGELETHLEHGSVRQDIYPRATDLRIRCLEELTAARRENIRKTPDSTESDELLTSLARTGSVMVYRDDRGVVVNLGAPLDDDGEIREASRQALALLGATAKRHPQFPVMLIAHTANPKDDARGAAMLETSERIMKDNGAKTVASHSVKDAAPVVHPKLNGATTKNERLEVIFVSPGR